MLNEEIRYSLKKSQDHHRAVQKTRQQGINRRSHTPLGYRFSGPEIKSRRLNQFQQPATMR